jgi:ELWxxDGT repeat protein
MELWRTDGTAAGTRMVEDINPGSQHSLPHLIEHPNPFKAIGDTLYFRADNGTHGTELWKSNGTAAGTRMVKNIAPSIQDSSPAFFTAYKGEVYFSATDSEFPGPDDQGAELWRTDGTAAGTEMVRDIRPGSGSSGPAFMTASGGILYFQAYDPARGWELYKSNGTSAGTRFVKDIWPGSSWGLGGSGPKFTPLGGKIYFAADHPTFGNELWVSDGTAAGTQVVKNIAPGGQHGGPDQLINFRGRIYFTATNDARGMELWETDGTTAGTFVHDLMPGGSPSDPLRFTKNATALYFSAFAPGLGEDDQPKNAVWKIAAP